MEVILDLKLPNFDNSIGLIKITKRKIENDLLQKLEARNQEEIIYSQILDNSDNQDSEELFLVEYFKEDGTHAQNIPNARIVLKLPKELNKEFFQPPKIQKKFEIFRTGFFERIKKEKKENFGFFSSGIFFNKKQKQNDKNEKIEPEISEINHKEKKAKSKENKRYFALKEEYEDLLEKIENQKEIFQNLVINSLEKLKLIGKVFGLKTEKDDFVVSSIDKIKKNIEKVKTEDHEDLEEYEKKLKSHFWNIHEVYLTLLKKLQIKFNSVFSNLKNTCQNYSIINDTVTFEGCVNKQKIEYINDLMSKFSKLGNQEHLHYNIFSALLDVFEFKKNQKKLFMSNLKNVVVKEV